MEKIDQNNYNKIYSKGIKKIVKMDLCENESNIIKSLKVPEYNGGSIVEYTKKFQEYTEQLKKHKYNVLLKFLNLWLIKYNITLKKIIDFKNIKKNKVLADQSHNNELLKKYSDELYVFFNVSEEDRLKDCENINDTIIKLIKILLNKIDYRLIEDNKFNLTIIIKKDYQKN